MEANPVLVLEFAGKGKKDKGDEDAHKEALIMAAKRIRKAKSDEDFASALMDFISLCQYSESEEVEEED